MLVLIIYFSFFLQYVTAEDQPSIPSLDNRIVGGVEVDISSYPYQLSLEYLGRHFCGGALLSPTWAITAAHCTDNIYLPYLTVRAGSSYRGTGGQVVKVANKYQHSRYDKRTIDYDVALLKLRAPLSHPKVRSVALPGKEFRLIAGQFGTVTGWGTTGEGGGIAPKLRGVVVPLIGHEQCRQRYRGFSTITDRMFCAGYNSGGKDSCQGDSGGPIVNYWNGQLMGVVSWGYGCARPGYPGVYTSVPAVRDFITNISGL